MRDKPTSAGRISVLARELFVISMTPQELAPSTEVGAEEKLFRDDCDLLSVRSGQALK